MRLFILLVALLSGCSASARSCEAQRIDVQLPGPKIGVSDECPNGVDDECSFNAGNVAIGVTAGIVSWKEVSGAALEQMQLPLNARPSEQFDAFLKRLRREWPQLETHSQSNGESTIVTIGLCAKADDGGSYELFFEYRRGQLIKVVERMPI